MSAILSSKVNMNFCRRVNREIGCRYLCKCTYMYICLMNNAMNLHASNVMLLSSFPRPYGPVVSFFFQSLTHTHSHNLHSHTELNQTCARGRKTNQCTQFCVHVRKKNTCLLRDNVLTSKTNVHDECIRNYCGLGIILSTHRDVPCFNAACDVK